MNWVKGCACAPAPPSNTLQLGGVFFQHLRFAKSSKILYAIALFKRVPIMTSRFKRQAQPAKSDVPASGPRSSFSARHTSANNEGPATPQGQDVSEQVASGQAVASSDPNYLWSLWKVTNPFAGEGADALQDQPNWVPASCPKCVRLPAPPSQDTLRVARAGMFWCGHCGFHGNGTQSPNKYRDSWLSAWRAYVMDPSHSAVPPTDVFATQDPSFIPEGRWASFWDGHAWQNAWHVVCLNDRQKMEDAFIWLPEQRTWARSAFSNPYPLAWPHISGARVVLVSHVEDYVALRVAGLDEVACLPVDLNAELPTAPAWRALGEMEEKMKSMTDIVLALRSDRAGRALEDELGRRMDRERCYRSRWRSDEDDSHREELGASDVLTSLGPNALRAMVDTAPPFPVIGVYELDDIEDRFDELYETGLVPGAETGWPLLDQLYTVKTGQWTLVTGIPGHGKSSWLDGLLVNLASMHGWRFGMFSPENQPVERHFASLMEKKLGKPFSDGPTPRITPEEKNRTKKWLNDRFKVILPDEENGLWTLDAVLNLARTLVYRYGIRGLVIDPWNELDHSRASGTNETSHISESLTKVRRFARLYDVHVWIVAHPTKLEKRADGKYPVATPYDVSGGAHWRNKADNALSIYRNVDEEDSDVCDIYVQKIRFREVGRLGVASLRCDTVSGAYIDDINPEKRAYALSNGQYLSSAAMRLPSPRRYPDDDQKGIPFDHGEMF